LIILQRNNKCNKPKRNKYVIKETGSPEWGTRFAIYYFQDKCLITLEIQKKQPRIGKRMLLDGSIEGFHLESMLL